MNALPFWKRKPFWIRLLNWEYWSFTSIYILIYPIFIFLCLRARSFFFYAAANPGIRNGGFLGESKKNIYALVPESLQPKTIFFEKGSDPAIAVEQIQIKGLDFPLIGKPDMGGKGRGVKKIEDMNALLAYVSDAETDFHIQEFIPYEKETGIFYHRFPDQFRGAISGIVEKEFLKVQGDGKKNVRELLQASSRAILQLPFLEDKEPVILEKIIPENQVFTVVPYGNHARGALFIDDSASVNAALVDMMDQVCKQIPGFFYGRLDIRYVSRELLENGKSFSILEVNGAGSEPTHIYDPRHSIFYAWKEIVRHWIILFKISRINHRKGFRYLSLSEGLKMFSADSLNSRKLADMRRKNC